MFATLGVRVILVEKRPRLLEFADAEIVEALSYHLRDNRVTLRLNEEVESVEEAAAGSVVANLESKKKLSGDSLLYAVGRQGNVDDLNLAAAGIEADSRGRILVDGRDLSHQKETHIYAAAVRHSDLPVSLLVSMEQGRIAAAEGDSTSPSKFEPSDLSVRDLHDPRNLVHRQNRGAAHRRRRSLRSGRIVLAAKSTRRSRSRGEHHRPLKIHFPSRDEGTAGRAHHRRGRDRTAAHRAGGDHPEGDGRVLCRYGGITDPTLAECYKGERRSTRLNKLFAARYWAKETTVPKLLESIRPQAIYITLWLEVEDSRVAGEGGAFSGRPQRGRRDSGQRWLKWSMLRRSAHAMRSMRAGELTSGWRSDLVMPGIIRLGLVEDSPQLPISTR